MEKQYIYLNMVVFVPNSANKLFVQFTQLNQSTNLNIRVNVLASEEASRRAS